MENLKNLLKLILIALILALMVNQTIALFVGPLGLKSYQQLQTHYTSLLQNIETLKREQSSLSSRKNALENTTSTLILAGRKVGFYQQGEKRVLVEGLLRADKEPTVGLALRLNHQEPKTLVPFVAIFFASWLGFFLTLWLFAPLKWLYSAT